jgi:hypothetical protein
MQDAYATTVFRTKREFNNGNQEFELARASRRFHHCPCVGGRPWLGRPETTGAD